MNLIAQLEAEHVDRDALEDDIFNERISRDTTMRIYTLKRDLLEIKRAVSPLIDICNRLMRSDLDLIPDDARPYFRDVYDHLLRLVDDWQDFLDREDLLPARRLVEVALDHHHALQMLANQRVWIHEGLVRHERVEHVGLLVEEGHPHACLQRLFGDQGGGAELRPPARSRGERAARWIARARLVRPVSTSVR